MGIEFYVFVTQQMGDEGSSVMLQAETPQKSRTEEDLPAFSKEPARTSDQ